jgi:7,8-dihydro-6-hydroxymethylpterin dimethyltransferase
VWPETWATAITGLSRGETLPGGSYSFVGVWGAVTGVGAAFSIILGANPVKSRQRQQVQQVTQTVLRELLERCQI